MFRVRVFQFDSTHTTYNLSHEQPNLIRRNNITSGRRARRAQTEAEFTENQ